MRNTLLYQKAKANWIKNGDENSKFFHAVVNQRRKVNEINGLFIDGVWVQGVEETKKAAKEFFQKSFRGVGE